MRLDPQDPAAHQALGMVYRRQGDLKGAATEFQRTEDLNKRRVSLQTAKLATNTGVAQLRQGDVDSAIAKFRAALKAAPDFPGEHYQLGLALLEKGERAEAMAEFAKAHQLDPHLQPPLEGSAGAPATQRTMTNQQR